MEWPVAQTNASPRNWSKFTGNELASVSALPVKRAILGQFIPEVTLTVGIIMTVRVGSAP